MERPRTSAFVGVSLDGSLDWLDPYAGEEHGYTDFIASVDTVVFGRATHDFVRSMLATGIPWPYQGKRCVVLTHRALEAAHGERVYAGDPATLLGQLHAEGARHVYVDGGVVIRDVLAAGLLDALTLSVVPCLIGSGRPLFGGVKFETGLTLEGVTSFKNGIAQLRYRAKAP